nr:DUF3426 domain-containing protein [Bordetella genomosp. 11]
MTTRCPHCGTAFKVVADQLRVRNGLVRCGVCSRVFDGHACVVADASAPSAAHKAAARPDVSAWQQSETSPVLSVRVPTQPPAYPPASSAPPAYPPVPPVEVQPPAYPPVPPVEAQPPAYPPVPPAGSQSPAYPSVPPVQSPPAAPRSPAQAESAQPPMTEPRPSQHSPAPFHVSPRPYAPPRHQPAQSYAAPEDAALPPAVLRGRDDRRRAVSEPREPVFSAPAPSFPADADDEDHVIRHREPYAADPLDDDEFDEAAPPVSDRALPREDRVRLYADRDIAEDDSPGFIPVPGEARTRYDDLTDAGMAPPVFMDEEVQRRRTLISRLWIAGCLLGLIVLGLQCIYIYRTAIATAVPALRPALEAACAPLGCQVGYARRLERISITASSLQPQSGTAADDAGMRLTLRVTLRNRYDKPQPWPALVLQLTDLSDTVVVRKVLLPENYLPPGTRGPFPAGGEQNLAVPLQVDGLHVNGYQLDKFFP